MYTSRSLIQQTGSDPAASLSPSGTLEGRSGCRTRVRSSTFEANAHPALMEGPPRASRDYAAVMSSVISVPAVSSASIRRAIASSRVLKAALEVSRSSIRRMDWMACWTSGIL